MGPSRGRGGAGGLLLLLLCVSSTVGHGLTTTPTSSSLPASGDRAAPTSSVSMATPTTALPSVSVTTHTPSVSEPSSYVGTTPQTASVSTGTQTPPYASTQSVSMTTTPASPTPVSTETSPSVPTQDVLGARSVATGEPRTATSETTETTAVSTTNTPTTPAPIIPNAEQFTAVNQTESSITLNWSVPANPTLNSFNYTLQFEENSRTIIGGPAGIMSYTVEGLDPARWYNFTLYTEEQAHSSSGVSIRALTAPEGTGSVRAVGQNSSSICLQWSAVQNVSVYLVEYSDGEGNRSTSVVGALAGQAWVNHTESDLRPATNYMFTVYSRLENISSSGTSVHAVTAPLAVTMVTVRPSLREVELRWSRDANSSYVLLFGNQTISPKATEARWVSHTVALLQEGTRYNYSIIATYGGVNSSTYKNYAVTTINCSAVDWGVTDSTIKASIVGAFNHVSASNGTGSHSATLDPANTVLLTGLYPGATYTLIVKYETFEQCQHHLTLPPPDISARCVCGGAGTIVVHWAPPAGVWSGVEVNVVGRETVTHPDRGGLSTSLSGLQPATTYQVTACLLSGPRRSAVQTLDCRTDATGVIAGSVSSVLLVLLLVALGVFSWKRRRPKPIRRPDFLGWSSPSDTYKPIQADLFEDHVQKMSRDDNRGFSEEYENFIPVGTENTCKAATFPDNKVKNRFTNVLPYDWCRVKLSPQIEQENSDYINASYLPGYSGSKEYIAAQGPLAGTLDDFWRMVWEQGVRAIAMVTNCIEGDRPKCEQYWPLDYTPCLYGDLLVTSASEQTQPDWTIRSFTVKNRATSEQRSVQHFHFRAWPDHGVPEGTWPLLQFRELLRRHIEQEGDGSPTLVHCSAGVGRTGTLVALDVLLQQLETEAVVDVATFVHKMRLSRPLMVQTESQYVFLHHCLLEAMQGREAEDEHTYQNLTYTNATALQQLPHKISSV
ncbi:receptor-type tyrosine-protein phosphatase H-like [Gadus chalcogrammus]|uniref:receptor-type tyrosine-protein phosphatase H-like n=1 Tax=Gadus chalcogrammus TaxID=1042646 RepID=UPI0024C482BA|nr:receptor-type tyrosine-protein phosphatase H-like [Gadus chalcogrammus]